MCLERSRWAGRSVSVRLYHLSECRLLIDSIGSFIFSQLGNETLSIHATLLAQSGVDYIARPGLVNNDSFTCRKALSFCGALGERLVVGSVKSNSTVRFDNILVTLLELIVAKWVISVKPIWPNYFRSPCYKFIGFISELRIGEYQSVCLLFQYSQN